MRPEYAKSHYGRHSYLKSLAKADDCKEYGVKVRASQRKSKYGINESLYWGRDRGSRPAKKPRKRYEKRGKKHSVEITGTHFIFHSEWELSQLFKELKIPFNIEKLYKTSFKEFNKYERRLVGKTSVIDWNSVSYVRSPLTGKSRPLYAYKLVDRYELVVVGTELKKVHTQYGVRITWWSDKDIGINVYGFLTTI